MKKLLLKLLKKDIEKALGYAIISTHTISCQNREWIVKRTLDVLKMGEEKASKYWRNKG